MNSFALTGGVATGKTTFGRILRELYPPVVFFDCDEAVGRMLDDRVIGSEIISAFGSQVADGKDGKLHRGALRKLVFNDSGSRKTLEAILHPRVREECLELQAETATSDMSSMFVADVPLLFESGFDFGYERSLLVATTRETQLVRLKSRNGYDDALAEAILNAQLPVLAKVRRADVVFWNEGPEEVLRHQISCFLQALDLESEPAPMAAKKKSPRKKTASKKTASKKTASKKTASKKTASKKTASKKTASKKTASKKTASKKTASKKTASKKTASKKTASKKKSGMRESPGNAEGKRIVESEEETEGEITQSAELEVVLESAEEASAAGDSEGAGDSRGEEGRQIREKKSKEPEPEPSYDVPAKIDVNEFRERSLAALLESAANYPIKVNSAAGKSALIFELLSFYAKHGTEIEAEGILEQAKENYAMLRDPLRSFRTSPDDFYVGGNLLKQHGLRAGQRVKVMLRAPRDRDKYLSALKVLTIEGLPPDEFSEPRGFDQLTSLFPEERFVLERPSSMAVRLIDIVAPLGKGQRGLIVAPPRGGKTILLKEIAKSIAANHPETKLIVLLLDERPEEVTDFEETVEAEVFSSTFDEPSKRHAQVSDLVLERARRLVELGKDVVILLDSLTRLARGYNNSQRGGGPVGTGGLSPQALQKSRKFFGAARNVEEGGSLTIVATCLIETESRMDDIIFEELKGTGNMEIRLDRELAESRIYPAIHIPQSGTRNDDRLYHPEEMERVIEIRRSLTTLPIGEALETLLRQLAKNSSNAELLMRGMI